MLTLDDFGINCFCREDANHLFDDIADKYAFAKDWTRSSYLGLTLKWNYDDSYIDISMPD